MEFCVVQEEKFLYYMKPTEIFFRRCDGSELFFSFKKIAFQYEN